MIARLEYDADNPERPRRELDRDLEVASWGIPGVRSRRPAAKLAVGTPYWWVDDEDASQSFLTTMGVMT